MANTQSSTGNHEYAIVDTAPSAAGYFTNPVNIKSIRQGGGKVFFSIRESAEDPSSGSTITVTLQFQQSTEGIWTDYVPLVGGGFVLGNRIEIDDTGTGIRWRAGVKNAAAYTKGSYSFGFDW
jgi:hypothetical protein